MQPIAVEDVHAIAIALPDLALMAFGLPERRHESSIADVSALPVISLAKPPSTK
jgi:hypothetical protein